MKKIIRREVFIFWLILIATVFLITNFCQAKELSIPFTMLALENQGSGTTKIQGEGNGKFDLSIKGIYSIYKDRDVLEDGKGLKLEIKYDWIYLWGSWERTELRLTGQRAGKIDIFGFGPGVKIKLVDGLSIFGEIGYYVPKSELEKNAAKYQEGLDYYWVRVLNDINRPELQPTRCGYKLQGNIGGLAGIELRQEISKGWFVNFDASYRFLNLKESYYGYAPIYDYIVTKEKRSFSGGIFGVGVTYRF